MKIILIIGLPASGKTTLLKKMNGHVFDDINTLDELPKKLNKDLFIADVNFCITKIRNNAVSVLEKMYPKTDIEYIYFENNPKKCIKNAKERNNQRNVCGLIITYSKVYNIPSNIIPKEIYTK